MEKKSQYIGFSYFKHIVGIKNINFYFETFYSEKKQKSDKYDLYFFYSDKNILSSSLLNLIFILKNFEKEFFSLNQVIIKKILESIDLEEFKKYIEEKPNSEYLRKIGFLLEKILNKKIEFSDNFVVKKTYINIIDEKIFLTKKVDKKNNKNISLTYKILDNSLGEFGKFNPIIIKENLNEKIFTTDFNKNLENINSEFDKEIIEKAINYLYTKETKGSLEIEGEKFHQSKNRGFLKLISNIPIKEKLGKNDILDFYNIIYNDDKNNYREEQNYIGSGNGMMGENIIEYIPPKPENVSELMDFLINFYSENKNSLNSVVLASILSTYFVLIHPFLDGNGRTSRFLFQYSLINSGIGLIGNDKIILPVSAYILLHKNKYYKNLENISKNLIDFIDFDEDDFGEIKVLNDTKDVYLNLDFTSITNYFYEILKDSININYKKELEYINNFYNIYKFIDENYNITSNNISFIVKNLLSNDFVLSNTKKKILEKKGVDLKILEEIEQKIKNL